MIATRARRWATGLLVTAVMAGATTAASARSTPASVTRAGTGRIRSVVVLGDSVAAGEGTRDGYVYQDRAFLPGWSATAAARGAGHGCGRSDRAYGPLVARALGARITNLACAGASFEHGIVLDSRYDRAAPDLVLITAGANSVSFERAFSYCVAAARGLDDADATQIASASSVTEAVTGAIAAVVRGIGSGARSAAPGCTSDNPGSYLQSTVLARAATVGAEAQTLAEAIRARGREAGRVPQIVFTTYPDPLPSSAEPFTRCPDAVGLGATQLAYMHELVRTMNGALRDGLQGVDGVTVVDPDPAYEGHRWCGADPWMYGPSILLSNPSSWAPFHPTRAGQAAIATAVLAATGSGR